MLFEEKTWSSVKKKLESFESAEKMKVQSAFATYRYYQSACIW
jgi:hypothetical protein